MTIQRTVECVTKGFREDNAGTEHWLTFRGPEPAPGADPSAPQPSGIHYHIDNVSREEWENFSRGGTYTVTIS